MSMELDEAKKLNFTLKKRIQEYAQQLGGLEVKYQLAMCRTRAVNQ